MYRSYGYLWVAPLVAAVALVFSLRWMLADIGPWHIDFQVYRFGVEAWWHGGDVYGVLPRAAGNLELPFLYPPFSLAVLAPFTALSWPAAVAALFVVDVVCLAATLYVTVRSVWPAGGVRGAVALASLALPATVFLEPVNATFKFGQVNLVLMALVAVDCLVPNPRWPRGVGVGLAAAIKLTPAAFLLFFLLRKDYRAAVTAAITGVAASAVGFAIAPRASMEYWFGGLGGATKVGGVPFLTNQSVDAVVTRLGLPGGAATALWLALVAVLAVLVVVGMRRAGDAATALMVNAGFALLASPTSWSHYWIWVAPALVVMLAGAVRLGRARSPYAVVWFGCAMGTAWLCHLGPFNDLPGFDDRELSWTSWQQVVGGSYPILGYLLILVYALPGLLPKRAEGVAPAEPALAEGLGQCN